MKDRGHARWVELLDFVGRFYREPLEPTEEILGGSEKVGFAQVKLDKIGPPALAEWFRLVGRRTRRDGGHLVFPEPTIFARWPQRPRATKASLDAADLKRGLLAVLTNTSGHGGWGLGNAASLDDPIVHILRGEMDDDEADEEFEGTLSQLLTTAVIEETLRPREREGGALVGPLGPLAANVKRIPHGTVVRDERGLQALLARSYRPLPHSLSETPVHADEMHTTFVTFDGSDISAVSVSEAAWRELGRFVGPDPNTANQSFARPSGLE